MSHQIYYVEARRRLLMCRVEHIVVHGIEYLVFRALHIAVQYFFGQLTVENLLLQPRVHHHGHPLSPLFFLFFLLLLVLWLYHLF